MGRLVVTAFMSVDGVVQAPGLPDEDPDGGFTFGGWTTPYADPALTRLITRSVLAADALLLGRRTYELFANYWPTADPADPRTARLNEQPKYVASSTLTHLRWNNSTRVEGNLAAVVTDLKTRHSEIGLWGSTTVVPQLLHADLVDEFVLLVHPLLLGPGKRLFDSTPHLPLHLTETTTYATGVALHTYQRIPTVKGETA
ncbi:dihydrofolate reductase family protein [Kribbella sp. NPDC056951]|uniref:dihydrofolate reductase family protein n=1 Tax=Kribbella sp. NPDC056951 TaxID=3345978 RepID=UPI003643030D